MQKDLKLLKSSSSFLLHPESPSGPALTRQTADTQTENKIWLQKKNPKSFNKTSNLDLLPHTSETCNRNKRKSTACIKLLRIT